MKEEERLQNLVRIRATTKAAFKRLGKFVAGYDENPKPDQLEIRLQLLQEN
jgi:hypothetical protein